MAATDDLTRAIDGLLGWARGRTFGSFVVENALASVDRDGEDEVALFVTLTLSDPIGKPTWPLQDVLALRRAVLERSEELGLSAPVYVRLSPVTNAPQEDDRTRTGT